MEGPLDIFRVVVDRFHVDGLRSLGQADEFDDLGFVGHLDDLPHDTFDAFLEVHPQL